MKKIISWLLAVVLIGLLFVLILQAKAYGDAYATQHRTLMQLESWNANPFYSLDQRLWKQHESDMVLALEVMPNNAAFMTTLGLLYQLQAFQMEYNIQQHDFNIQKATDYFRQATRSSPAWMYGWMNLAQLKYRSGQIDVEYGNALLRAMQLGPWERDGMALFLELGISTHHLLKPEQEALVEAYMIRVVSAKGVRLGRQLRLTRSWDGLCEKLIAVQGTDIYQQICNP